MKSKIVWLFFCLVVFPWICPQQTKAAFLLLSDGSDGPFHPTYSETLPVPPDGIFNFTSIHIPDGVRITFERNVANTVVSLLATEAVTINGILDVSGGAVGDHRFAGPGGFDGGPGGAGELGTGASGFGPGGGEGGPARNPGGGGGFATAGTDGLTDNCVSTPGLGGQSIPYEEDLFFGGSGGGGGGGGPYDFLVGGDGGGGGGAVYLSSPGGVTVDGSILAKGGNGDGCYTSGFCGIRCGPAGGGSGGFIWIQTNALAVTPDGLLSCAGGAGGVRSSDGTLTHFGGDGGQGYLLFNTDDSIVDGQTVGILMQWPLCLADLDGDNDIDGSDLALLAGEPSMMDLGLFAGDFGKAVCE
jgi:hypothetical protein